MNKITIFVGDIGPETAASALAFDQSAVLLTCENYTNFLNDELPNSTFYTALGDLPKPDNIIYRILDKADDIYYCPCSVWSDNKEVDCTNVVTSTKGRTEFILFTFATIKNNVHNLDLSSYLTKNIAGLVDQRKSQLPQLWVAGGSDTNGVGITKDQRYGSLLGKMLDMEVSFLSVSCASIKWLADQIIRSDIRAGDFVVVGLVPATRFPYWSSIDKKIVHINLQFDKSVENYKNLDITKSTITNLLLSDHLIYESMVSLYQIISFCRKIQAKLLILGLQCTEEITIQLHNVPEFVNYVNLDSESIHVKESVDFGDDGRHPGPLQHQLYADFCYNAFKKLNYLTETY